MSFLHDSFTIYKYLIHPLFLALTWPLRWAISFIAGYIILYIFGGGLTLLLFWVTLGCVEKFGWYGQAWVTGKAKGALETLAIFLGQSLLAVFGFGPAPGPGLRARIIAVVTYHSTEAGGGISAASMVSWLCVEGYRATLGMFSGCAMAPFVTEPGHLWRLATTVYTSVCHAYGAPPADTWYNIVSASTEFALSTSALAVQVWKVVKVEALAEALAHPSIEFARLARVIVAWYVEL